MYRILFVCTGNTCRSCMAEGIFNSIVEKDESLKSSFISLSAGTDALEGDKASSNAIKVLAEEYGIDISGHTARCLTYENVYNADLILTMTYSHKQALSALFPEASQKIYTLKEITADQMDNGICNFAAAGLNIQDPFGMSLQAYSSCAREINEALVRLIKKLKK